MDTDRAASNHTGSISYGCHLTSMGIHSHNHLRGCVQGCDSSYTRSPPPHTDYTSPRPNPSRPPGAISAQIGVQWLWRPGFPVQPSLGTTYLGLNPPSRTHHAKLLPQGTSHHMFVSTGTFMRCLVNFSISVVWTILCQHCMGLPQHII